MEGGCGDADAGELALWRFRRYADSMNDFVRRHERLIFGGGFALAIGGVLLAAFTSDESDSPAPILPRKYRQMFPADIQDKIEVHLREHVESADQPQPVDEEPLSVEKIEVEAE
jgi:hypothetical protein